MSSLIEKVKDKLHAHSETKSEQPEGTHGPHSSRTANAADPRVDSDRDNREALGRHDGSYTTGGDNYSYGSSNTKGMNTAGDTLASSAKTGPAPTTAGVHKSDMMNKADPRIDSDLDGSRNMGLRSEKATHDLGTTRTAGTSGATTGTGFGTGMGTDTLGAGRGVDTSDTTGTYTGLSGQDRTSGLGSGTDTYSIGTSGTGRTSGLGSGTDTYSTGTSGTGRTSGLGSGTDTYSTGTSGMGRTTGTGGESTARIGSISTDAYGQPAQHTTRLPGDIGSDDVTPATKHHGTGTHGTGHHSTGHHGAGNLGGGDTTTTSAYGGMGSLGGGFGTDRQATGPAPNTAGPHKSDMMNKADPRVDSDLDNSKTFGGDKTYQS